MINYSETSAKKLIEQGKTANYPTYAIDEIILVVIGILIAFHKMTPRKIILQN